MPTMRGAGFYQGERIHHPCVVCGETHEVCCDNGFTAHEDGSVGCDDAMGAGCCTNNHGPAKAWPTYERMDCDQ